MYSSKISSSIIINKKSGEVKLSEFKVNVDGYSRPAFTEKAKDCYNSNKDLNKPNMGFPEDWPVKDWHDLYWSIWDNLLKWKKRVYKKD